MAYTHGTVRAVMILLVILLVAMFVPRPSLSERYDDATPAAGVDMPPLTMPPAAAMLDGEGQNMVCEAGLAQASASCGYNSMQFPVSNLKVVPGGTINFADGAVLGGGGGAGGGLHLRGGGLQINGGGINLCAADGSSCQSVGATGGMSGDVATLKAELASVQAAISSLQANEQQDAHAVTQLQGQGAQLQAQESQLQAQESQMQAQESQMQTQVQAQGAQGAKQSAQWQQMQSQLQMLQPQITSAFFGRYNGGGTNTVDVTGWVKAQVAKYLAGSGSHMITANNAIAGDPWPGTVKTMWVNYTKNGVNHTVSCGEGQSLDLSTF